MKNPSFLHSFAGSCGAALAAVSVLASAPSARAVVTIDPANDFLSSYTGPRVPELDVTAANATFDGTNFTLTATLNGNISATPAGFYVFGINRGTNTQGFGTFAPGILFDATVVLRPANATTGTAGSATVTNTGTNTGTFTLAAGTFSFTNNTLTAVVPGADLPSAGFNQTAYQYDLWPRNAGGNAGVSDFAPDTNSVNVSVVPEPGTVTLLGLAAVALPFLAWRRRAAASA